MARYGRYDPNNSDHSSSLFVYGEVPLESAKLNRWNGNLKATLDFLTRNLAVLLGANDSPFIVSEESGDELRVVAFDPPALAVRVLPGAAMVQQSLAGLDAPVTVPNGAELPPPSANPRIDAVYLTSAGTTGVVTGNESAEPLAPTLEGEAVVLAHICWRTGATSIKNTDDGVNAYIVDVRPLRRIGGAHRHGQDRIPPEQPDGERQQFSTATPYVTGTLDVYLNGALQQAEADYSEHEDCCGYTFAIAPELGDVVQHRYVQAGR